MQNQADQLQDIYASPRQAALLFLVPGLLQGLAVYGLIELVEDDMPSAMVVAGMFFALVAPAAHFLTTTQKMRIKAAGFATGLGLFTAALYMIAENSFGNPGAATPAVLAVSFFANVLICYIAVPFFRTVFEQRKVFNHYPSLFGFAWNLPVIVVAAGLFTLAFWAVLGIWAALFSLIGIEFFGEVFSDELFVWPATFGAGATAIGIVREREGIVLALRNILFALLKVLSPVLMAATVLFTFSAIVQGLDQLWDGWSAATLMVSAIAMAVVLSNAVIADEGIPDSGILRWSVRLQAFVLPVLAGFALYAMYLRLSEYGLTVARIYALILVLFASSYAVTWFVSALRKEGYDFLRQANIWLAGALFVVAVLVQTPVINTWSISANDQIARLKDGRISAEEFDYAYFQFDLGRIGRQALQRLKSDGTIPEHEKVLSEIERVEAAENAYSFRQETITTADRPQALIADGMLEVLPAGTILNEGFVEFAEEGYIFRNRCTGEESVVCIILKTTAFQISDYQYVFFQSWQTSWLSVEVFYEDAVGNWQRQYTENIQFESENQQAEFIQRLRNGETAAGTITFRTLDIGDEQIYLPNISAPLPNTPGLDTAPLPPPSEQ